VTRAEALLELAGLARGLPPGTVAERASKLAERIAASESSDLLRSLLVDLALERLVMEGRE
jgi:hypothetical protein